MKKQGLITRYPSPETQAFPQEFRDPQGYWTCVYLTVAVLAYNTRRDKRRSAARVRRFAQSKWKGRMALDANEERWVPGLMQSIGREKTVNYLKPLAQQEIYIRRGRTLLTQLLLAGEFDVQIVAYWHEVNRLMRQKAPIGWVGIEPPSAARHRSAWSRRRRIPMPHGCLSILSSPLRVRESLPSSDGWPRDLGSNRRGIRRSSSFFFPNAELVAAQLDENHKLYESLFLKK